MEKIFIPYQERAGKVRWPNKARVVIPINFALEFWGQEELMKNPPPGAVWATPKKPKNDLSVSSSVEYSFRVGFERLFEMFKRHNLKFNLVVSGMAAERYPDIVKRASQEGHEIVAHSYDQGIYMSDMTRAEQKAAIKKSISILEKITGIRPVGWLSPGIHCNKDTVELIMDAGFLWHADLQDDELPYLVKHKGKTLVEVPYRLRGFSDHRLYYVDRVGPHMAFDYLKAGFDAHYALGERIPTLFALGGIHAIVSGRPEACYVWERLIEYIKNGHNVWFAYRKEIAEWWLENIQPQGQ
jgi:peptidoglycan/xylan/chitin deacetylase (PgdA/CDA1 family)